MLPSLPFGKGLPVVLLVVAAGAIAIGLLTGDWTFVTIAALAIAGLILAFPLASWILGRDNAETGEGPES